MSSGKYIKLQYSLNNVKRTKSIKLNEEENIETNFKNNKNILNIPLNANTFHLIRDNQKILLDKNVKVKDLNIKEGDLIVASIKVEKNEIENSHNSNNISSANLNEKTNQDSNIIEPINPNSPRKRIFLLIAIISLILVALTISLICYFIFHPKDSKGYKINNKEIDKKISTNQTDPIDPTNQIDQIEPTNQIEPPFPIEKNDEKENDIINATDIQEKDKSLQEEEKELLFQKEIFVTKKTYPSNRLFLFSGEQLTEMKVEGENIKEEDSYHNFSKTCDFIFITRDSFLEKNDSTLIEKTWYSGYIAIYNLIIPNSTHDNHIIYDQKINEYLRINKRRLSSRILYKQWKRFLFCKN